MLRRDHWSYDEMDFVYIIDIYWEIKEFIGTWVHIFFYHNRLYENARAK